MSERLRADAGLYEVLEEVARARAITSYLEIGVQEGDSLRRVLAAAPQLEHLLLCDTWCRTYGGTGRGSSAHIEALLSSLSYRGSVQYLTGRSQDTLPKFRLANSTARFDLVTVDGDHSEAGAGSDLSHGWALCGGVLVAHDTEFPEVWRAILAFGRAHADEATATAYFGGHGTIIFSREATA